MRAIVTILCLAVVVLAVSAVRPAPTRCGGPEGVAAVPWVLDTVARGVERPWSVAVAPDGRIFFTERPGRLKVIDSVGAAPRLVVSVVDVATNPDTMFMAGLLGLALDPGWPAEPYFYMYHTYQSDSLLLNRVVRYRAEGDSAVFDRVIVDQIPASTWQNGGRVAFGPDGKLYVPTGGNIGGPRLDTPSNDSLQKRLGAAFASRGDAQDVHSLVGKILRLNPDGSIPADNPFPGLSVFSYGHRHAQGLAWSPETGVLYDTEHGPPGGHDEVNRILPGQNYGWPLFKGMAPVVQMRGPLARVPRLWNVSPIAVFTPAIGPSGASFYSGKLFPQWTHNLFVATLAGQHLHRLALRPDGQGIRCEERLLATEGFRMRSVTEGPDGAIYLSTTNTDQPSLTRSGDDMILRIVPAKGRQAN